MIVLEPVKRTYPRLLADMAIHYSQPKGFVGRNICYAVVSGGIYYGGIVGGSSTLHLPGRDNFFGITPETKKTMLKQIVNNIFFHVEKKDGKYPCRNFTQKVLAQFRTAIQEDWLAKYGDPVVGHETLIELPRTGEVYRRDGWTHTGQTVGFTCKRTAGIGSDGWSGKRVWNTDKKELRPKHVFTRLVDRTDKCELNTLCPTVKTEELFAYMTSESSQILPQPTLS